MELMTSQPPWWSNQPTSFFVHLTQNDVTTADTDDGQAMASDGGIAAPSTDVQPTQEVTSLEDHQPKAASGAKLTASKIEEESEEMSDVEPDDPPEREAVIDAAVQMEASEMTGMEGTICTFDDLFTAMTADLANPLPTLITPLHTPVRINDEEEVLQLHPSPVSSLEEPTPTADKDITSTLAQVQTKKELSLMKNVSPRKKAASSKSDSTKENVKRRSTEDYAITHKKIRDARSNTEMSNKDRDRAIIMRRKVT